MANWAITATTIYCDSIDDEVTLLVYKDGTLKCTGSNKPAKPDKEKAKSMRVKNEQIMQTIGCTGPECYRLIQYRDKLLGEYSTTNNSV